jgi:hypothetical protein
MSDPVNVAIAFCGLYKQRRHDVAYIVCRELLSEWSKEIHSWRGSIAEVEIQTRLHPSKDWHIALDTRAEERTLLMTVLTKADRHLRTAPQRQIAADCIFGPI